MRHRFFDSIGKLSLDIDFDDHGHPKAHPMGAHAHDYDKSGRTHLRKLKDWELKIVQEIQAQEGIAVKKSSKYITLEQYKRIMDTKRRVLFYL